MAHKARRARMATRVVQRCRRRVASTLTEFAVQVFESLLAAFAFQVLLQAPEGDADDVAMVQAGTEVFGEAQPDFVGAVDILRPQTRRMRPQVDVDRRPARTDDFEREGMPRLGQMLPGEADAAASSSESMRAETPVTRREACSREAVCTMASKGSTPGTTSRSTVLPSFSATVTTLREQLLFVVGEELLVGEFVFAGAGGDGAYGHDHDIVAAQVGFFENAVQVRQVVVIANRHQDAAGARVQDRPKYRAACPD